MVKSGLIAARNMSSLLILARKDLSRIDGILEDSSLFFMIFDIQFFILFIYFNFSLIKKKKIKQKHLKFLSVITRENPCFSIQLSLPPFL